MNHYFIGQEIIITNFSYKIDSNIQYYSQKKGNIKGFKKLRSHITLYLIEFLDYSRIWFITYELKLRYNN